MLDMDDTLDMVPDSVRSTIAILHLSALAGVVSGIGFFAGPLIVWLVKREEHPAIDAAGKDAVNFQLTMLLAGIVAGILCITIIGLIVGIPLAIAVGIMVVVLPIIAGVKASNGQTFRYPLTVRFIK